MLMEMHELINMAKVMNINPEWYLREYFQRTVLYGISALNLSDYYVFQGGTALRIVYGSPRLSLDMDFTIINRLVDALEGDATELANFLSRFFSAFSLNVTKSREKMIAKDGFYRFFVTFDTLKLLGRNIKVKLELVTRKYHDIKFKREIIIIDYPTRVAFSIQVKTPSQMLVDKLCSLAGGMHRGYVRWRDLFDIYWLMSRHNAKVDMKYFEQEFGSWIESTEDLKRLRDELVKILEHETYDEIIEDLRKVLQEDLVRRSLVRIYLKTTIDCIEQVISE